ncbi:dolichyl-phosphate-mannose-protein mannosyltransferase [Micromonospora sp. Llam0]|nr:dolichyl-phosphate-mannose-protein mannosyltransferase [Micromonospora sp. Llam0]
MTSLRRHLPLVILLAAGLGLRIAYLVAYRPAFWFHGDSGEYLLMLQQPLEPHPNRPIGYVLLLSALQQTRTLAAVAAMQHLLSLLLAVGLYALLRRRGVVRWLATLAAVPLIFDSLVLTMGHYLLPDLMFMVLFAASVGALLWSPRPGPVAAVVSGGLIAVAWVTKPTALPVALLLAGYLVVRRVGWRPVLGYLLAFGVPYVMVMVWIGDRQSVYSAQSGTALYGRAAMIADCDRIELTDEERIACPDQPPDQRWDRADAFFWRRPARLGDWVYTPEGARVLTSFSRSVISQQPGDYLATVGRESAAHFVPGLYLGPMNECLRQRLVPPVRFRSADVRVEQNCPPAQASIGFQAAVAEPVVADPATPLTRALHQYGGWTRGIPVVMSLAVLLTVAALAAGRRVAGWIRFDTVLLVVAGPGLAVFTVAIGMYEPRYALPALPLAAAAAALAAQGLIHRDAPARPEPLGPHGPVGPQGTVESAETVGSATRDTDGAAGRPAGRADSGDAPRPADPA